MRIAINTRFLLPHKMEGFGWYTHEIVKRIVQAHPEHEFYFFFDRAFDPKFIYADNVTPIVLNPPARHPILFILWFELAVKKALKKHKIDLFFSPDGYLSLSSKTPQIGVIHDINFEHFPQDIPLAPRIYLRYFFSKFAKKAEKIITVSEYSKNDIAKTYQISTDKITAIWNGASDEFKPIVESEKIETKVKYSNRKNYFLFVGALHPRKNVKRLLEAYKIYHKKTENPIDLVIVGSSMWNDQFENDSNLKSKIHFTGHVQLSELTKIMASATIFVYVPYFEGFGIPLVEAMKCGTPIISGNLTSLPEVCEDAAIYCNPFDVNEIAEKMIDLQKNQDLQKELSEKSLNRSKQFSWDTAAQKVWEVIYNQFNEF